MSTYTAKCDICGAENTVPSYGDWHCKQCGQGYEYDEAHQIRLTDAQWALLRNPPRWIAVGERLPKADADVLLTDGEEVVQAWFEEDDGWQAWHTSDNWRGAKAWMPLPEPPEVK